MKNHNKQRFRVRLKQDIAHGQSIRTVTIRICNVQNGTMHCATFILSSETISCNNCLNITSGVHHCFLYCFLPHALQCLSQNISCSHRICSILYTEVQMLKYTSKNYQRKEIRTYTHNNTVYVHREFTLTHRSIKKFITQFVGRKIMFLLGLWLDIITSQHVRNIRRRIAWLTKYYGC